MSQPRKTFTTAKGTELPILNLKGREYLQVAHRLVLFRETHPNGVIKTQMMETNGEGKDRYYIFKAEIYIETDRGPMLTATGYKRETVGDFPDAMEKAETGSIGRALGIAGFGTQFLSDELDEGKRLADAPTPVVEKSTSSSKSTIEADFEKAKAVANATAETVQQTSPRRPSFRKNVTVNGSAAVSDDI